MSCLPFATLVDLWAGELAPDQAAAAEEHLFACDPCAATSERLGALITGLRGVIPPVISHAHRDRLVAEGARVRVTQVVAGTPADVTFDRDVDLLVHALRGDLTGVERVDVEVALPDGTTMIAMAHVPFDVSRGEVLIACQRHYRAFGDPTFHVHAVTADHRREIGSYFVRHAFIE